MTTAEILSSFLKGNEVATISEKQRSWLIGQAGTERLKSVNDGFMVTFYVGDALYVVRNCKTHVSGYGGTRGTRSVPGRYILEKKYAIRFDSTGLTGIYRDVDLKHFREQGHSFCLLTA